MKQRRVPRSSGGEEEAKSESMVPRDAAIGRGEREQNATPSPRKFGLSFILNEHLPVDACAALPSENAQREMLWRSASTVPPNTITAAAAACAEGDVWLPLTRQLERTCSIDDDDGADETKRSLPSARSDTQTTTSLKPQPSASKKRGRTCKAEGCENYIVHKGLCCRHGGGKKCSVDGCESSAKHGGRCWKHGGSVECKIPECTKKAKAKGLCWGHGGGAKCQAVACTKVAISNGFCWAHGGGRRCIFDGCQRPAFERTHSFCLRHYDALQDVDYYEV